MANEMLKRELQTCSLYTIWCLRQELFKQYVSLVPASIVLVTGLGCRAFFGFVGSQ